jgi:hypothetical protein
MHRAPVHRVSFSRPLLHLNVHSRDRTEIDRADIWIKVFFQLLTSINTNRHERIRVSVANTI